MDVNLGNQIRDIFVGDEAKVLKLADGYLASRYAGAVVLVILKILI